MWFTQLDNKNHETPQSDHYTCQRSRNYSASESQWEHTHKKRIEISWTLRHTLALFFVSGGEEVSVRGLCPPSIGGISQKIVRERKRANPISGRRATLLRRVQIESYVGGEQWRDTFFLSLWNRTGRKKRNKGETTLERFLTSFFFKRRKKEQGRN